MATATRGIKDSRFDMRMTHEQRAEVERAAAIKGKSLTQWALDNLLESARRDIEEESTTLLSRKAFAQFAEALDQPMADETRLLIEQKPVWV